MSRTGILGLGIGILLGIILYFVVFLGIIPHWGIFP